MMSKGRLIGWMAGIGLTMLSAVLVSVSEGVRTAAFSLVGRGLSPGEASITCRVFHRATHIHYITLAIGMAALLILNRSARAATSASERASDRPSRRLSWLAAAGCLPILLSLAGPGLLGRSAAFSLANYVMAAILLAGLVLAAVTNAPFPRGRFLPALRRSENFPGVFCAVAALLSGALLYLRGAGIPTTGCIELTATQLRACEVYAGLMTAANTAILAVLLLAAFGLIGQILSRMDAGATAHLLACCFAVAGLAGFVLSRTLAGSAAREIDLLELGPVLHFVAAVFTLLLTVLLFLGLKIIDAYYPDKLDAISSPLPLVLLPLAFFPVIWAVPPAGWVDARTPGASDPFMPRRSRGWVALNIFALAGLAMVGYAALFGILFNPWYTIYSTLKGFIVKYLCVCGGALAAYHAAQIVRRSIPPNGLVRVLAGALLLSVCLPPFVYLHRDIEVKHALTQYSETARMELDMARSFPGLGRLLHAGERPRQAPAYHPCPGPWTLNRDGERVLPKRISYILICVDALRGDALSRAGNPRRDLTPFLDRWTADECVFFDRAYSQGNGTFNSLPVLMGGRGNRRDLVSGLHEENALYQLMVSEGVDCRFSFEGHGIRNLYPPDDTQFTSLGAPYREGLSTNDRSIPAADCLERVKKAVSALAKNQTFFVYVHLMDVHNDLYRKEEANDYGESPADLYANNVNYLDRCMCAFVGWLKAVGRYDHTVIVFTSDHGEGFGEHAASMHGHNLYEEDIRVPLILRLPGIAARTVRVPVAASDLTPTLVDLAGRRIDPPYDDPRVGISVRDLVLDEGRHGPRFERRDLFLHSCFTEKYGLLRDGRYKLIDGVNYESYALFDLREDPYERRNVINLHRELAADMKRALRDELRRIRGIGYASRLPWE